MSIQLNSSDRHSFVVSKDICHVSKHIMNILDMSDPDEEHPEMDLITINGANLEIIVSFMKEYAVRPFDELTKDTNYDTIPEYYRKLLESTTLISEMGDMTDVTLMNLLIHAESLQINSLVSLIAYNIARLMRSKSTIKDIYVMFGIPADHVPKQEDIDKIRNDYAYVLNEDSQSVIDE